MDDAEPSPIRIHPRPATEWDGWLRHGARVEGLPGGDAELWFDFDIRHSESLTSRADPWPLVLLFAAMQCGSALTVDGQVSRALLTNLEAFQAIWRLWVPGRYRPVRLTATSEVGEPRQPARTARPAVMLFDGGFDSYYTALKHARRLAGTPTLRLRAGLMVLGPPTILGSLGSDSAVEGARALLGDLGLDLWTMRTNAAPFVPVWEHARGAVLASCLHWFSGGVDVGVLPVTGSLTYLRGVTGFHPLTDAWLGSDRMRIVHDGAEHDLVRKAEMVATWPAAMRRMPTGGGSRDILARLALSVAKGKPTDATPVEPTPEAMQALTLDDAQLEGDASEVLRAAGARGLQDAPWHEPLRQSLARAKGAEGRPPLRTAPSADTSFVWASRPRASEIHVFPELPALVGGRVLLKARIEGLGARSRSLWFSLEARHTPNVTSLGDPFACALQFPAMRSGAALVIHGPVSRVLLRNLEHFQQVWHAWAPERVTPIPMRADQEVEGAPVSDGTLILFSGGLDSSFSVYRHHRGLVGRRSRRIAAGLMVLGFDIPRSETAGFEAAFENSRRMLASLGIELWGMETNFRDLVGDWEPGHGTAIAACVHCLAGHAGTALVAATASAARLSGPWGTHILTDRLLSSDRMHVVTDGEDALGRLEKAVLVAEWPEAMRRLRVCFVSERRDRNCGECPKCVMTSLAFLVNRLPLPSTLPCPTPERVRRLPLRAPWEARSVRQLLARAEALGVADQPSLLALPECLRWNEARWAAPPARWPLWETPLWPRVRRLARKQWRRIVAR